MIERGIIWKSKGSEIEMWIEMVAILVKKFKCAQCASFFCCTKQKT